MIQKVTVKSWKSYERHTPKGNEKMKKQEQQKKGCRERSLTSISRRVSSGAMLVALAMIFSYVESLIPFHIGIPGVKLGLANLIVVVALYKMGTEEAYALSVARIVLSGFLFANLFSIIYSLAGGMLSLTVMVFLKKKGWFSVYGVSLAGGVMHNVGQLLIAMLIVETFSVSYYLPVLLVAGAITGLVIGILAEAMLKRLAGLDMGSRKEQKR